MGASGGYERRGDAPCLFVGVEIGVKRRRGVECGALHRLADDLWNLRESAFAHSECMVDDLVGSIEDARHVSSLLQCLEGETETGEFLSIRLEEFKRLVFEEVESGHVERQTFREGERLLDGQPHVGQPELSLHRTIAELHG